MLTLSFYVLMGVITATHGFLIYEEQKRHDLMEEQIQEKCDCENEGDQEG